VRHHRAVPLGDRPPPLDAVQAWADSGAMALTGRADGPPLGPPEGLVPRLRAIAARVPLDLDPLALLAERAALLGLRRRGTTSCGGAARLLPCADGWLALSLARRDDVELVPAWLGLEAAPDDDPWPAVRAAVGGRSSADLMAAAAGLGLPVGAVPTAPDGADRGDDLPVTWRRVDGAPIDARVGVDGLRVVELASLWAGPLCGSLLADLGAEVVKVDSTGRPDGARAGDPAFFALLNAGKQEVAVDLGDPAGREELRVLVAGADVVIEGSRPRALRALGIDADEQLGDGPRAWISITAHGRDGDAGLRVGFGDDAAAAGGLVTWEDGAPRFCADAIGDPVTGLVAAAAALEAVARGGRWLVDAAMAAACAHLAGPTLAVPEGVVAAPPRTTRKRPAPA
jgi:hypothetical protein